MHKWDAHTHSKLTDSSNNLVKVKQGIWMVNSLIKKTRIAKINTKRTLSIQKKTYNHNFLLELESLYIEKNTL